MADGDVGLEGDTLLSGAVIDAAMTVHSAVGAGLLEHAYGLFLALELRLRGVEVRTEVPLPVHYRGIRVDVAYRLDLVVEQELIVEVKAISRLAPIHDAQIISYLRLSGLRIGLLINFHERHLKDGIRRFLNG